MKNFTIKKHETGPAPRGQRYQEIYKALAELGYGEWISIEDLNSGEVDGMRMAIWQTINHRSDYRVTTRLIRNGTQGKCTLWLQKCEKTK